MKNDIVKFVKNLQFLFRPNYWVMNYSYNETWDTVLNHLLDSHDFVIQDDDKYVATLNGFEIWVTNHPYASFTPYDSRLKQILRRNVRPSRLTLVRAHKMYQQSIENNQRNQMRKLIEQQLLESVNK
jgi:hypothetical protein